jgi:nucleoid DNA-binding protein
MGYNYAGKGIISRFLRERLGYTHPQADKVVEAFISILKKNLGQHKTIELEGLGTLSVIKSKLRKRRTRNTNWTSVGPTILTRYKKKYLIKFKHSKEWRDNE